MKYEYQAAEIDQETKFWRKSEQRILISHWFGEPLMSGGQP